MSEETAQPVHSPDQPAAPEAHTIAAEAPAAPAPVAPAAPAPAAPTAPAHLGYAQQHPVGYVAVAPQSATNGLATAALILGIIGFLITMIPFFIGVSLGGVINILAFVFGIVGAVKSGKLPGNLGRGAAVTGIVLSSVAFVLMFVGAGTLW